MKAAVKEAIKVALERQRGLMNDRQYYLRNAVTAREAAEKNLAAAKECEKLRAQEVAELVVIVADLEEALAKENKRGSDNR